MRKTEQYLGRPVRSIQTMLALIAKAENAPLTLIPDGVFGRQTAEAVREFQKTHGLSPSGSIDHPTWNEIVNDFVRYYPQVMPAAPLRVLWQPGQVIAPDGDNTHLLPVQSMLRAVGEVFPAMPKDDLTEAVRWMQEKCGLPCSGELCQLDWFCLCRLYSLVTGSGNCPL